MRSRNFAVSFVLMFLFVLGLPPVHAVDVDGLDFRVGVGSGVLEDQSYLDSTGEDFVDDGLLEINNNENNVEDVVGSLENEDSGVGLKSENNNNNNDVVDSLSDVDVFSLNGVSSGVPSVLGFSVSGDFDRSKRGVGFYKNVRVSVTGENFTGDNFLSKEGLHWSNKTRVEPITARKLGVINDPVRFFPQNTPNKPVDAYSMNNGDSGRITFVGKTQSNIDLDIIWTVTSSDKNAWISGSGFNNDGKVKGLGFTGEQYMPNSNGNSIVVLYNQANTLGLHYKIVKHGTMEEVPVLVSFISTDIDAGQGVDTDLDNITRIVPPESNLKIDGNLIYDATPGVVGLNGSNDLPKGGYIGVGFVSSFNYTFFSPAPRRANEYQYSSAVRYDIFGSSLQANVDSRIIQNLSVEYKTIDGMELSEPRVTSGFVGDAITSEELTFDGYTLVEKKEDYSVSSYPKITYVYKKDTKQVTPTKPNNPVTPTKPTTPTKPPVTTKPSTPTTQPVRPQTTTPPRTITRVPQTYVPRTLSPYTPPRQSQHLQNKITPKKQDKAPGKTHTHKNERRYGRHDEYYLDSFNKNLGTDDHEKKILINYIRDLRRIGESLYGNDKEAVNKYIATKLAYPTYYDDTLQPLVNDFGDPPPVKNWARVSMLLKNMHTKDRFRIDMTHLGASLGASYVNKKNINIGKEAIKKVLGLNPGILLGVSADKAFFLQNSITGDDLTYITDKDMRTDFDAYNFMYHNNYLKKYLDTSIVEYYHTANLDKIRQKQREDILKLNNNDEGLTPREQSLFERFASAISLGGIGLSVYYIYTRVRLMLTRPDLYIISEMKELDRYTISKYILDPKQFIFDKIKNGIIFTGKVVGGFAYFAAKKKYYRFKNKVLKPIKKVVKKYINKISNNIKKIYKTIKPVFVKIKNKISKIIPKNVFKSFFGKFNKSNSKKYRRRK